LIESRSHFYDYSGKRGHRAEALEHLLDTGIHALTTLIGRRIQRVHKKVTFGIWANLRFGRMLRVGILRWITWGAYFLGLFLHCLGKVALNFDSNNCAASFDSLDLDLNFNFKWIETFRSVVQGWTNEIPHDGKVVWTEEDCPHRRMVRGIL
jgi:hypothetical protein